jgi:hypothetical protein
MNDQFDGQQNDEALQRATQDAVKEIIGMNSAPEPSTALVAPRPRDASGKFVPRQKLSKTQKSQQTMQRVLGKKDESGKTLEERVAEHLLNTALTVGEAGLMAGAKAFETVEARAHGKVPDNEMTIQALERQAVRVVVLAPPELMHPEPIRLEDLQKRPPRQPSFAAAPLSDRPPLTIEGKFTTNPAPVSEPKKQETKTVECRCVEDSPMYCQAHKPSAQNSEGANDRS